MIENAILSWTRLIYSLSVNKKNDVIIKEHIEEMENYLSSVDVKNLKLVNQSKEYYTVEYTLNDSRKMKQFDTSVVEKNIY